MLLAERALAPIDAVRSSILRRGVGFGGRAARSLVADRDVRVAAMGAISIACAFALTCASPLWLLALGPICLGVPHLFADARYLVIRPRLHERAAFWAWIGAPVAAAAVWPHASIGLLAISGGAIAARGAFVKRAAFSVVGAALALFAYRSGRIADLAFAHAHNVVAVVLWWAWAAGKRRGAWHLLPIALFVLGVVLSMTGTADALVWRFHAFTAPRSGLDLSTMVSDLSFTRDPIFGLRLVLAFAFAQSVHYAIWLRLIPDDDRPRAGVRSFVSSARALAREGAWPLAVLTLAVAVALLVWAAVDLHVARSAYVRVAGFHGYLELGVAVLFLVEGRFPLRGTC